MTKEHCINGIDFKTKLNKQGFVVVYWSKNNKPWNKWPMTYTATTKTTAILKKIAELILLQEKEEQKRCQ